MTLGTLRRIRHKPHRLRHLRRIEVAGSVVPVKAVAKPEKKAKAKAKKSKKKEEVENGEE